MALKLGRWEAAGIKKGGETLDCMRSCTEEVAGRRAAHRRRMRNEQVDTPIINLMNWLSVVGLSLPVGR
jgi:hypothetical protein